MKPPVDQVAAVIIAAGSSSRLGQPKQLLVLNGQTLLQHTIRVARQAGASPLLVVLGAHREQIESQVDFSGVNIVVNSDWEQGMASSVRAGLQALQQRVPETAAVLFMTCDQPALTSEHLGKMLAAFRQDPAAAIASVYLNKRGTPAIFPREAFEDLRALHGDQGARGLLSEPGRKVIEIPFENGELDIDRPEDLARLRAH